MTTFEQLQQFWNEQPAAATTQRHIVETAKKRTAAIKNRHRGTILLLGITVAGLVWYFTAWSSGRFDRFAWGGLLMIGALLMRVLLEFISFSRFRRIDVQASLQTYTRQMALFYTRRRRIHYIFTPLILVLYYGGFVLLLPVFRAVFSTGFYWYIVCSGAAFGCFIAWLIARQVKQEMKVLRFLKGLGTDDTTPA